MTPFEPTKEAIAARCARNVGPQYTESKSVSVTAFKVEGYDIDLSLAELIATAMAEAPPEFRDALRVEVESEYESSSVTLTVGYKRPETAEETRKRVAGLEDEARASMIDEYRRARANYEELKRVFG